MKKINRKAIYLEGGLLLLLGVFLLLLVNPFSFKMRLMLYMGTLVGLIALYIVKLLVVWLEKPQDERDLEHRFKSSWISYNIVSVLLFTGVIFEAFQSSVDVWLVLSLAGMFFSKLLSLLYLEIYR